jgi:hypothetical protein
MFKSIGHLVYDPQFPNQRETKPFWLMLSCDGELTRYYAWLLFKERCIRLHEKCLWGSHISVIRGEQPKAGWWGKYGVDEDVEFGFDGIIAGDGTYFWMEVVCPRLSEIRGYYGLTPQPWCGFHLTIGNNVNQPDRPR